MPRHEMMFVGIGLLSLILGVPLAQRRVRPNRWYGLRLPATFADETVWYDANAATGRDMMALGAAFTSFALLLALLPGVTDVTYAITCGLTLVGATRDAHGAMDSAGQPPASRAAYCPVSW